eukprot:TRINITY_DN82_c0_g1_i5.p1 TRINITY_DN82_c0_g1~~TRINITY_DN82_c0_g1_i5.p1  ORF type:complete len:505 (+),score=74.81 TRINITY_DN82_c0_g1_i5:1335-2849(+)
MFSVQLNKKATNNEFNQLLLKRFIILQNDKFYVIDSLTNKSMRNQYLIQIAIFENKGKGKCQLTYYSKMQLQQLKETLKSHQQRIKSLLLIKSFCEENLHTELQNYSRQQTKKHSSIIPRTSTSKKAEPTFNYQQKIQEIELLKSNKFNKETETLQQRVPGYVQGQTGGITCINKEELKCQEGVVMDFVKQCWKQLIEGKDLVGISLPVRIFEPKSTLHRIAEMWCYAPLYLKYAASIKNNPVERLKYVLCFSLAGIHTTSKQLKPFNPILGETYQGTFADGTVIDIEHTSHHPAISNFFMEDKNNYQFYGHYKYSAKILKNQLGNAMQGGYDGPNFIKFADGSLLTYQSPTLLIKGLLYGTRSLDLVDTFTIYDNQNDLQCQIKFYDGGGLFSKRLHKTDYFEGSIAKISSQNQSLCKVEGSWLEYMKFDGVTYWDLEKIRPLKLIQTEIPLPSDCRYREDLIYLAQKNLQLAQEWKVKLEVLQRADRKFRADKHPSSLKHHK